jgi:hypothetical protein
MLHRLFFLVPIALLLLPTCGQKTAAQEDATADDASAALTVTVYTPADLAKGLSPAVDDLVADLQQIGVSTVARGILPAPACAEGHLDLLVQGVATDLVDQEIAVQETLCGTGRQVTLRGGGIFAAQWAIYAWLEHLGVRYLHPEQTLYPDQLTLGADAWTYHDKPVWPARSIHAHRTHPIDLSAPLDATATGLDMPGIHRRWVAWNVKMRQTEVDGWDYDKIGNYAFDRGFQRGTGFSLDNTQQGAHPLIDPGSSKTVNEQLAAAIDERMLPVAGQPDVTTFGFTYGSNEFAKDDPKLALDEMTFITTYINQKYPGVQVSTINHGTHMEPTPPYNVRYYDLSGLAPPELEVSVHMLMFYDLTRSACGMYGNPDYTPLREFILAQKDKRRIEYYPESSWWLTFDLPVPLYLAPVSLDAREADFKLLAPFIAPDAKAKTGLISHHVFSSGQEWGYWLIDYCTAKMTWNGNPSADACIRGAFDQFPGGNDVADVLQEVNAAQVVDMRDPEIVRFLVGTDDPTETAFQAGIVFHPLPPMLADVLGYSDAQALDLTVKSLDKLDAMALKYAGWTTRVDAIVTKQDAQHAAWMREVRDGLAMFGLRAAHASAVYRTVLELRAAVKKGDAAAIQAAAAGVDKAKAITEQARKVVTAREADYRYPPALTIAGDEPGTPGAVPNDTIYPYRYLSRVHRLFYWTRPDNQLAALFGAGLPVLDVPERILILGESFAPKLLIDATSLSLDWGDGKVETSVNPHIYAAQGLYDWKLSAIQKTGAVNHVDKAAVVERRIVFAKGSLQVELPKGGDIVGSFLPGFVVGIGKDQVGDFFALGRIDGKAAKTAEGGVQRVARTGLVYGPGNFDVALGSVGTITLQQATVTFAEGSDKAARTLTIEGKLPTDELVAAIVNVGGFAPDGARSMIAITLGYTVETLPKLLDFRLKGLGTEG